MAGLRPENYLIPGDFPVGMARNNNARDFITDGVCVGSGRHGQGGIFNISSFQAALDGVSLLPGTVKITV